MTQDDLILQLRTKTFLLEIFADLLERRKFIDASRTASDLAGNINRELNDFVQKNKNTYNSRKIWETTKNNISTLIDTANPVLSQHRGYKQIIANIIIGVLTIGIALGVKRLFTGSFLFFNQTKTSALANDIKEQVKITPEKLSSPNNLERKSPSFFLPNRLDSPLESNNDSLIIQYIRDKRERTLKKRYYTLKNRLSVRHIVKPIEAPSKIATPSPIRKTTSQYFNIEEDNNVPASKNFGVL